MILFSGTLKSNEGGIHVTNHLFYEADKSLKASAFIIDVKLITEMDGAFRFLVRMMQAKHLVKDRVPVTSWLHPGSVRRPPPPITVPR